MGCLCRLFMCPHKISAGSQRRLGEHLQKMMGTGMDRGMQYLWARDVRLGGNGDLAEVHLGGRVGVLRAGGRGWGGMPRVTHLPRCATRTRPDSCSHLLHLVRAVQ